DASKGDGGNGVGRGETGRIAKAGRSFDVLDFPQETWDAVFETLLGELRAEGHDTLLINRKKKTTDKSRYYHCEVICAHAGHVRRRGNGKRTTTEDRKP
ncbi:unnamed protein product, partial [Ectocarpus sp. 8 AP-2014]